VEAPLPAAEQTDPEDFGRIRLVAEDAALPIPQLRQALDDLFAPNPLRYWLDFLASTACFYGGFAIVILAPIPALPKLGAFVVSVLGLYRGGLFIHELAHFPRGRMRGFRMVWNLLCGFPIFMPDFLYESHVDHHRRAAYGTADDGEYLPWGRPGGRPAILFSVASSLLALPTGAVRFGILGPLSWFSPNLRQWMTINASSLAVDMSYRRVLPPPPQDRRWRRHEAVISAYLCALFAGVLTGVVPAGWVLLLYLTASAAMLLNSLRTLAAHRYRSPGTPLTMTEQLLDSVNYPRDAWLNELWAPVGLRFHALHHLFPGIPYHNLATAHARLLHILPSSSPYHQTEGRGLVTSLRELWRAARTDRAAAAALGRRARAAD
jgi:fatty acid desaturase